MARITTVSCVGLVSMPMPHTLRIPACLASAPMVCGVWVICLFLCVCVCVCVCVCGMCVCVHVGHCLLCYLCSYRPVCVIIISSRLPEVDQAPTLWRTRLLFVSRTATPHSPTHALHLETPTCRKHVCFHASAYCLFTSFARVIVHFAQCLCTLIVG
jgi:hypothetical protein